MTEQSIIDMHAARERLHRDMAEAVVHTDAKRSHLELAKLHAKAAKPQPGTEAL